MLISLECRKAFFFFYVEGHFRENATLLGSSFLSRQQLVPLPCHFWVLGVGCALRYPGLLSIPPEYPYATAPHRITFSCFTLKEVGVCVCEWLVVVMFANTVTFLLDFLLLSHPLN